MTLAIDLESIKRLTNLADINRALHETHAKERSIEAELEELLSKRSAIEETFVTLHDSASEVCTWPSPSHPQHHLQMPYSNF